MSRLGVLSAYAIGLVLLLGCSAAGQRSPPEPVSPQVLDVRLASDKAAPGFQVRQHFSVDGQSREFFLESKSVLSDQDITRARTKPTADGMVVEVLLTAAAAARLRETTANNIGKYMAVLAHGRLASAATIQSTIPRADQLTIGLTIPAALADTVRSRVAARWPEP